MSKARIQWKEKITPQLVQSDGAKVCGMLNAADIEDTTMLQIFSSLTFIQLPSYMTCK